MIKGYLPWKEKQCGLPNKAYCIEKENDRWYVYYSERAKKTGIGQ